MLSNSIMGILRKVCGGVFVAFLLLNYVSVVNAQIENRLARELLEQTRFNTGAVAISAAVSLNGKIVFSEGTGYANLENEVPATGSTVYRIASISKPISAIGVMQLIERGLVSLDDPIQKYVPAFPEKLKGTVTILHLLTHSSGVRHYNPGEFGKMEHFATLEDAIQIFKDDPLRYEPGTDNSYTTYGFNLLQGVIEKAGVQVGGRGRRGGRGGRGGRGNAPERINIEDYLRRFVWNPAGMLSTYFEYPEQIIRNRARGYTRNERGQIQNAPYTDVSIKFVGGGVISTVEDLVRIFTALDNGTLIKPETVQTMYTTPRPGTQNGMGLGWSSSIDDKERLRVSHSGGATGFRSMLINYPAQELVVSTITNCDFYSPGSLAQQIADIYLAAIDAGKN